MKPRRACPCAETPAWLLSGFASFVRAIGAHLPWCHDRVLRHGRANVWISCQRRERSWREGRPRPFAPFGARCHDQSRAKRASRGAASTVCLVHSARSMIQSMHGESLVETLLNTLEAERYARGPMLLTIVDELCARGGLETAADAAFTILEGLESGRLSELDFAPRVRALRHLVRALSTPPESEVRVDEPCKALARALPPRGATASAS